MELARTDQPEFLIRYGSREPDDPDPVLAMHDRHTTYSAIQSHYKDVVLIALTAASVALIVVTCIVNPLLYWLLASLHWGVFAYVPFAEACLAYILGAWFIIARQWRHQFPEGLFAPTDIGISESCLRLHQRSYLLDLVSRTMPWDDMISVQIENEDEASKKQSPSKPHLLIADRHNRTINLSIAAIRSIEERRLLVDALKRKAPRAIVGKDIGKLIRIGQINDIPFTKLWSGALNSTALRTNYKPLLPDTLLQDGRFRIKEQIDGGGQGAVYSAVMLEGAELPKQVVLKEYVLPDREHTVERKRAVESFEREVWALAKFRHDGIVQLFDAFVEDHRAYLVLEQLNGLSLKKHVLERGALSQELVCKLGVQMCEILAYLHSMHPPVLHLDFSPENLILNDSGKVVLIDFNTCSDGTFPKRTVIGKQRYMAPEQYRGKPSSASDIYSLGATLFYLLTSKEPEPITISRPSSFCQVNTELDNLVARATAMEEIDRFENASAFRDMLIEIKGKLQ